MPTSYSVLAGKALKRLAELRGGGSALPGLVIERVDPSFLQRTLADLPHGVVLISGTNGKTTTTKMVVELLESQDLRVFTNRTGSNFTRGVVSALLGAVDNSGKLEADIAVLELDEAHAVHFVREVKPNYSLFLNVMRDQLDRFGEIDTTANFLRQIAEATTDGIIINREDPRLNSAKFLANISAKKIYRYGVSPDLLSLFPSDDSLRHADGLNFKPASRQDSDTVLESSADQQATISYGGKSHQLNLELKGIYNVLNAVASLALTRLILGSNTDNKKLLAALSQVKPAFGRGEAIIVDGQPCELVLVKNPSGFRLSLSSFDPADVASMIAINDNYADGRDMSWLWDVEFNSLQTGGVAMVSGVRAYDMALRLQYDEVETKQIDPKLTRALHRFLQDNKGQPKRIYCTYTAMLTLRRELAKIADVSEVRA